MTTTDSIIYLPRLTSARVVKLFRFGAPPNSYRGVLVTDCQGEGPIQYVHVMFVHRGTILGPACFAVAAEVNKMAAPGVGSAISEHVDTHFLGVFRGAGGPMHENWGASDDWADLEKFTPK